MEWNEFSWERNDPGPSPLSLTTADIAALRQLMSELRDLTLSRATYSSASEFLKRFGGEADGAELVRPEALAH